MRNQCQFVLVRRQNSQQWDGGITLTNDDSVNRGIFMSPGLNELTEEPAKAQHIQINQGPGSLRNFHVKIHDS